MNAEVIVDESDLLAIDDEWRRLAVACGNIFVTPDWFAAWRVAFGETERLFVVVLRDADSVLRGVVPFEIANVRSFPVARFAGSRLGDHFQPAADPSDTTRVGTALGEVFASESHQWAALRLDRVDADAAWVDAAAAVLRRTRRLETADDVLPFIDVGGRSWAGYRKSLTSNLRKTIPQKARALERRHELAIRFTETEDELARDVATFHSLHLERRSTRGGSSLEGRRALQFLTELAGRALRRGWLRLAFLEIDGEPVAAHYCWSIGGRYCLYSSGFSTSWAKDSVGMVLRLRLLEAAMDEGAHEVNLLRGDEPYKAELAAAKHPLRSVILARKRHPIGALLAAEVGARALLRRLPDRLSTPVRRVLASRRRTAS